MVALPQRTARVRVAASSCKQVTLFKQPLEKDYRCCSADGSQAIPEQIAQAKALVGFQILFTLEQEPARFL
jgi:hypothetical protein